MSYYYNYYLGYEKDGKLYPLGPYDDKGKLHSVLCRSRSFASDLHRQFCSVQEGQISEELRKEFEWEDWNGEKAVHVKYLPANQLPNGSFFKSGYFLIEDVQRYEKEGRPEDFDGFYEYMDPTTYAAKAMNELHFGMLSKLDEDGQELNHSAVEYMYYVYCDYNSEEYEAHVLKLALSSFEWFDPEDGTFVILETEG